SIAYGALDQIVGPGKQRSAWRSEPFRQRDSDQVEGPGQLRRRPAAGDGGVPDPRAIEIRRDLPRAGGCRHAFGFGQRKDYPAGPIVRVLDLDDRGRRIQRMTPWLAGTQELVGGEDAAVSDLIELNPRVRRAGTGL